MAQTFDPHALREQFPSLAQQVNGQPAAFFDGPGGTQTPQRVIDAMSDYLSRDNSNLGGAFVTSQRTVQVAAEARDMQGNKVMINDETGFTYGGDGMGKYAEGKVGTGKKDPSVCGSFSNASCSMKHLQK